jgi:hypothetical protein
MSLLANVHRDARRGVPIFKYASFSSALSLPPSAFKRLSPAADTPTAKESRKVIAFSDFYFYIFQGALIIMKSGKKQFMKLFLAALSLAFAFVFCSSSALAANNHPIVKTTTLKTGQQVKMIDWTGGHHEYYEIEEMASNTKNRNAPMVMQLKSFSSLPAAKQEAYDYAAGAMKNESRTAAIFHPTRDNKDATIYEAYTGLGGMKPFAMPGALLEAFKNRAMEMYGTFH